MSALVKWVQIGPNDSMCYVRSSCFCTIVDDKEFVKVILILLQTSSFNMYEYIYLKDVAVRSFYYKHHINSLHFCVMQLWDLNDILQGSGKTITSQAVMADGDSDEIEM